MNKHLTGVVIAVLTAAVHITAPAFAGHRPGNVVVMGGTWSLTGRNAVRSKLHSDTMELYVDELNARGGLLGHKVALKTYDDKSDRRTAIELYEKLIVEDKVDLIQGPFGSYLTDPAANVMERYKRPFIAHGANPAMFQRGRKYIFTQAPNGLDYHKGALFLAKQIGIERIAIISVAAVGARAVGAQKWAKKLGLNVVFSERYRREERDFTGLLNRVKASRPDAILAIGRFPDQIALFRQFRELKINVKLLSATIGPAMPKFVEELGGTAEYVVGFSAWEPKPDALGHPGMKAFIESYEKRYGEKPNYQAAGIWGKMQILEAAVRQAGSFDPQKVRNALATISLHTVRGPWKADERGLGVVEGVTFQIQNGERMIVWPATLAEAKLLLMPKWEDRAKK